MHRSTDKKGLVYLPLSALHRKKCKLNKPKCFVYLPLSALHGKGNKTI